MKRIIGLCLLCFSVGAMAQPIVTLNRFYGNAAGAGGQSFVKTSDGGYILLGVIHANGGIVSDYKGGSSDMWVVKLDATYGVTWQKCLGGSGADLASGNGTGGTSIQQTADGGYIVVGVTQSTNGDITVNHGGWDAFVVKLTGAGAIQWAKTYGGANDESDFKIRQTPDGGFLLAGTTQSSNTGDVGISHGNRDAWIVKLDNGGAIQWQRCIGSTDHELFGNFVLTADGGYMLAMCSRGNDGDVSGNHNVNRYDYWVAKMNNTGAIVWSKCYGGTDEDYVLGICEAPGGFVIAGYTYSGDGDVPSNNGDTDCWFLRIDNTGGIVWKRAYGGVIADLAYGIEPTSDGGFIAACTAETLGGDHGDIESSYGEHDGWLLKLRDNGSLEWQKCVGGTLNDWGMQVIELSPNNFLMLGQANSNDGSAPGNPWPRSAWLTLVSASGTLPVHFLQFDGRRNGNDVLLDWEIEPNPEGKQFVVEKSNDGSSFQAIANIPYRDNMDRYQYRDDRALLHQAIAFYRIIAVDINDKRTISRMIRIAGNDGQRAGGILGNPVRDQVMVELHSEENTPLQLAVYDANGRTVLSATVTVQRGSNIISQPLGTLPNGMYYLQLTKAGKKQPVFKGRFLKTGR